MISKRPNERKKENPGSPYFKKNDTGEKKALKYEGGGEKKKKIANDPFSKGGQSNEGRGESETKLSLSSELEKKKKGQTGNDAGTKKRKTKKTLRGKFNWVRGGGGRREKRIWRKSGRKSTHLQETLDPKKKRIGEKKSSTKKISCHSKGAVRLGKRRKSLKTVCQIIIKGDEEKGKSAMSNNRTKSKGGGNGLSQKRHKDKLEQ